MGAICSSRADQVQPANVTNPQPPPLPSARAESSRVPEGPKPADELMRCLGEFTSLITDTTAQGKRYIVTCTAAKESSVLTFCTYASDGQMHYAEYSASQLLSEQSLQRVPWPAFFSALRKHFQDHTLQHSVTGASHRLVVNLDGVALASAGGFPVALAAAKPEMMDQLLVSPLMEYYLKRKDHPLEDEPFRQQEATYIAMQGHHAQAQHDYAKLARETEEVRQQSAVVLSQCKAAKEKCDRIRAHLRRLLTPESVVDDLYNAPWQEYPLHTPHCAGWTPNAIPYDAAAADLVRAVYASHRFCATRPPAKATKVPQSPRDPNLQQALELSGAAGSSPYEVLRTLEKIDDWDFDVFQLQQHTKGGSLFMVVYCLLHKYGFTYHFNLDPDVVVNWCTAVEAGYHPNPYHNSTHAADVTQVVHYILFPGGMFRAIPLTAEDVFAAIISGAIHDFDHPGFNNNFHVRTNAYLAILYNDRSVLENHHCAAVFDLMKNPKFNLLQSLSNEQRKDVRDTMLEMVLSTDMGNHAKIFQTFRQRLQDESEWCHKDDVRLALSIAIKMADISNCSRPRHLYLQWANKISEEFYKQGDVERQLQFTVSPFMDRLTHKADFPKGQMSFMNYIVIPLFEAGSEFVPQLEWTIQFIQENKEYWQCLEEEEQEEDYI